VAESGGLENRCHLIRLSTGEVRQQHLDICGLNGLHALRPDLIRGQEWSQVATSGR
jgi:hypothetical protein